MDSKLLENSGANDEEEDDYPNKGIASMLHRLPDRPNEDLQYSGVVVIIQGGAR